MQVPNGMTLLSKLYGTVLIPDAAAGTVWKLNVYTGASDIVFDDPLLKPIQNATPSFGINGIHVVEEPKHSSSLTLYFANTNHGYLGTVPITCETGRRT